MANIIKIKHGAAAPTVANLNDFELGYSINEQKLYIKEVKNGVATLRSFSSDGRMNEALTQINGNIDSLSNALTTLRILLNPDAAGAFYATGANTTPVFGTLPIARGGTGRTSNPKMLVDLASTSTAKVFATDPRPGVTGTLPIANGGTGLTASPSILIDLTSGSAANVLQASPRPGVSGTLPIAKGGTGLTASPSLLINLASTSAANVLQASPRPGVTGTLPLARGGTGASLSSTPSLLTNLASTSAASIFSASPRPGVTGTLPIANGGTGVTQKYTDGTITWTSNAKLATESTAPLVRYFPYLGLVFVQLDFQLAANLGADKSFNVATSSFLSNNICALSCYATSTSWRYDFSASILKDGTIRIANSGSGSASASNSVRVYITGFFTYGGTA